MELSEQDTKGLLQIYPLSDFEGKPRKAIGRMTGADRMLACPTYLGLAATAEHQPETYLYRFEFDDYAFKSLVGSMHAMEIPLIFDSMDRYPISMIYTKGKIKNARPLSRIMQGYWVNFAKTGDPNGPGLPVWPSYDPDQMKVQVLDHDIRTERFPFSERCSFWDQHPRSPR